MGIQSRDCVSYVVKLALEVRESYQTLILCEENSHASIDFADC